MSKQNGTVRSHSDRRRYRRRTGSIADNRGHAPCLSDCPSPTTTEDESPAGRDSPLSVIGQDKLAEAGSVPDKGPRQQRPESSTMASPLSRGATTGQKNQKQEESCEFAQLSGPAQAGMQVDSPTTTTTLPTFSPQVPGPETNVTHEAEAGKQLIRRQSRIKPDAAVRRKRNKAARSATATAKDKACLVIDTGSIPQELENGARIAPDNNCVKGGAPAQLSPAGVEPEDNEQQREASVPLTQAKSPGVPTAAISNSPEATPAPLARLRLCNTEDCSSHARLLNLALHTKLDPCDDFEAFVCSAWHISEKHRDQAGSVMDDLRMTWYDHFEDTLSKGTSKFRAGRKPLAMYNTCRHNFPSDTSQIALIRQFLDHNGFRWPEPPEKLQQPLDLLVTLSYKWESPYWITVNLLEPSANGKRRIEVAPGLYLPILRNQYRRVAEAYDQYWQMFLELMYPDPAKRPAINITAVNEIRAMEEDVLGSLHAAAVSPRKRPAAFPFIEIGAHVPNTSGVDWSEAFQAGMSLQPRLAVNDDLVATDVGFLSAVAKLLAKYSLLKLNEHITWLIVQHYAPLADYAFLVGYYGSNGKAAAHMSAYCAQKVETVYKVLLLALGFLTRLTARDRRVIEAGFHSLLSAASRSTRSAYWMSEPSKAHVIRKLGSVKQQMWPPKDLLDDSALEKIYAEFPEKEPSFAHYWIKALEVMSAMNRTSEYNSALLLSGNNFLDYAGYDYVTNTVRLAMGAVAAPAYYVNGTKGMLYGGLLFLLATQVVRAIDDEGIKWLADGTVADATTVSTPMLQAFRDRAKCRDREGNGSVFPEVPALEVAYAALSASHLVDKSVPLALTEQLPEEKVFFMTLCYMSCSKSDGRPAFVADCNKANFGYQRADIPRASATSVASASSHGCIPCTPVEHRKRGCVVCVFLGATCANQACAMVTPVGTVLRRDAYCLAGGFLAILLLPVVGGVHFPSSGAVVKRAADIVIVVDGGASYRPLRYRGVYSSCTHHANCTDYYAICNFTLRICVCPGGYRNSDHYCMYMGGPPDNVGIYQVTLVVAAVFMVVVFSVFVACVVKRTCERSRDLAERMRELSADVYTVPAEFEGLDRPPSYTEIVKIDNMVRFLHRMFRSFLFHNWTVQVCTA
ncbi:hypothetical protein HPB50_016846 [Hyalomma asiaticum]|uniref:Uncharacterized protein n=1 Tax=Hyalomma asiaticum TaxID=266040 RepID=A0ACB7S6Y0_HYAAI|nr:hypothetical protein HPB50_016846 [Hyalomma asiaticum]